MPFKNPSEMTDAELDAELAMEMPRGDPMVASATTAARQRPSAPAVDNTQGMGGWELAAAGLGQRAMRIPRGLEEIAIGAYGTPEELVAFNKEKAEQQKIDQQLMSNWQAKVGGLMGDVGIAALGPAKMGPQVSMAMAGAALSPTSGDIRGMEIPSRLMQSGEAGLSTAAIGVPLNMLGKSLGAATKRYTPEGQEALRLDEAAKRLGVKRNVGSLDQSSGLNAFESNLPGYAKTVEGQVKAFTDAGKVVKDIPSKSGKSFESRSLEGENVRSAIQEAGENLKGVGTSLWNDLDSYIVQNNLPAVSAKLSQSKVNDIIQKYTPIGRKGLQLDKNPILQRIEEYDPDAAHLLTQFMANPKTAPQIPFSDLHKVQSAVGRAMGRAEKDASAPGASIQDRKTRTELKNLYGSLMSDVDSWGTKNPKAQEMFDEARTFWRDVVVPGTMTNKVYNKASRGIYGMNPRGYMEPKQLYSEVVGNPRAMQDLYPYMPQQGRDLVDTLSTMPDVARSLISGNPHPAAPGMGTMTTMAGMLIGSPLQLAKGAISHLPGAQRIAQSGAAKRAYFAKNVLERTPAGQVAWGAAQYPQEQTQGVLRGLRERVTK